MKDAHRIANSTWHLVVEVDSVLEHLLGASDVEEDVGEGANGVLIATHHHVREAHVVERADLTGWHARIHVLEARNQNII